MMLFLRECNNSLGGLHFHTKYSHRSAGGGG